MVDRALKMNYLLVYWDCVIIFKETQFCTSVTGAVDINLIMGVVSKERVHSHDGSKVFCLLFLFVGYHAKPLPIFPVLAVASAWFLYRLQNKKGHPAGGRFPC